MKKDNDEKLQSLRGKAMKAFRKIALPVVAAVALSGGMVAEANAQSTQSTYGTVTQTQQVQQQKPWANDAEYREKIRLEQQEINFRMQTYEARAKASIANYNASIMRTRSSNLKTLQRLRERGGNFMDIMAQTQRMAAAETQHNARVATVHNNVEAQRLKNIEAMNNFVERLDRTYARTSPYKEILEQQQRTQQQRVISANERVQQAATVAGSQPRTAAEQEALLKAAQERYQEEQLRKFQDAQIKAASEGKPLPKREDFGLAPERPQESGKQRVSTASLDRR